MGQIREEKLAQCLREVLDLIFNCGPDFVHTAEWPALKARAVDAFSVEVEPASVVQVVDPPLVPDKNGLLRFPGPKTPNSRFAAWLRDHAVMR